MYANQRLSMFQSHIDHKQKRTIPSFPFLSIEEQENYELSKSLQQATPLKSANMTILPSPSPLASTSSLPLMGSCVIGSNGSTKAVHQQDQQQEQQRPTPPQLPHLISNLPITPITSSSSTPELDVVETKLVLNDVLKEFNNGKILCLSKDDDDGEDNEKIDIENESVIYDTINEISEDKFTTKYDAIILNRLGQESSYEISNYLKKLHNDIVVIIRDEFEFDNENNHNNNNNEKLDFDFYVDLENSVIVDITKRK